MSASLRQHLLIPVLALTLLIPGASGLVPSCPTPPDASAPQAEARDARPPLRVELELLASAPSGPQEPFADVFAPTSWEAAARAASEPRRPKQPARPTAPAVPFSVLGRFDDGEKQVLLLVKGDRLYPVWEGDVVENTYRIARVSGDEVELVYLPLNVRQKLPAGG